MFENDLAIGKRAEERVKETLLQKGHNIEDVSNDKYYQSKDIDFILSKGNIYTTLEIKNDIRSNETGNVFIETYNRNNQSRNAEGWFCYCEASFICFVQEKYNIAHIVSREELVRNCWNGFYKQLSSSFSCGYIVPIAALKQYKSYYCLKMEE